MPIRLDNFLVEKKYFESRNKATNEIKNGNVFVNGKKIIKASFLVNNQDLVHVDYSNTLKYVSRGGNKLEEFSNKYKIDFDDKIILDIGASTGGFTDFALQNNAKKVYCIDVGSNQLHEKIKKNPKIINYENCNINSKPTINDDIDIILCDCSFVSISNIIDGIKNYLTENNFLILLLKPQFEIGKVYLKNGIIKDKRILEKILNQSLNFIKNNHLKILNVHKLDFLGKDGNQEYFLFIKKE